MQNTKLRDPAVDEFIAEGKEIIERVGACLQLVETNGGAGTPEQVGALYRDMHTLKGSAQLFGYRAIALVAHAMEASLDPLRKTSLSIPSRIIDACLKNLDLLDRMLKAVEQDQPECPDRTEVTQVVAALVDAASSLFQAEIKIQNDVLLVEEVNQAKKPTNAIKSMTQATTSIEQNSSKAASTPQSTRDLESQTISRKEPVVTEDTSSSAALTSPSINAPTAAAGLPTENTVRVHVSLLDRILNLVGELVLVRNQMMQHRSKFEDAEFLATTKNLDVVTSDLQGEVMKTRMQPIESVVSKFQRLVRDVSRDLQKRIDLTVEGGETELDKSLLEAVKDPLTHIVRNSCDHGIETPQDRKKAGKPETGHLLIRAFHEGGQIVVEVSDDGRGLNRQRITAKALEKGLITAEKAPRMSDREICELIFLPGFSTASQVTSVSGRGVGMDVVKTNIEKIGGSAEVSSIEGKGTTLRLRIPLTLAIVPALLVRAGKEKFAIPQVKLVELVQAGGPNQAKIEYLQGRPMYRLRGNLLPLLDIREITLEPGVRDYTAGAYIVVLSGEAGECFGLLVNEIMDTADIVVKPMSAFLKHINVFSGATILGDGSIALILDVSGVAEFGRVLSKRVHGEEREVFSRGEKVKVSSDIQEFLLFSVGTNTTHAIPLCLVQRLEEFDKSTIEFSGEQRVARYRGALLPLIDLKKALNYPVKATQGPSKDEAAQAAEISKLPLIVVQRSGRNYGIEVDEILDVVTIDGSIDDAIRDRNGILGNIIFQDSVVVVVDALGVIERINPVLSRGKKQDSGTSSENPGSQNALEEIRSRNRDIKFKKIRVLYAEDVAFFRRHVSKVLNEAGIDVTTVEDGSKALEELEASTEGQYNLILSDIEMPKMNGIELAREIRKRDKFNSIPLIALTTRFRDKDIADGKAAGFDIYLEKLNPEKLMEAVQLLMAGEQSARSIGTGERSIQ